MNATWRLGYLFAVTFRAPYLRCVVLGDGFGALERLAAFTTPILIGRHVHLSSDGSNEIALAQFYTAMAQNVVSGGAMEIEVGHHEMH